MGWQQCNWSLRGSALRNDKEESGTSTSRPDPRHFHLMKQREHPSTACFRQDQGQPWVNAIHANTRRGLVGRSSACKKSPPSAVPGPLLASLAQGLLTASLESEPPACQWPDHSPKLDLDSGIFFGIFFRRLTQGGTSSPRSWLRDLMEHLRSTLSTNTHVNNVSEAVLFSHPFTAQFRFTILMMYSGTEWPYDQTTGRILEYAYWDNDRRSCPGWCRGGSSCASCVSEWTTNAG